MFSPLFSQDHSRVFLVAAGLCPGAKGSRSFFLVTTANSYSVMIKNKSFLKQMSRVIKILDSGLVDICGHREKFPPDRGLFYVHT